MPWSGGVYTRGYASWTNDANSNLPISSTKFDTEDNDFATGLNNCLTVDGLNKPNAAMTWGLTTAQVLALTRGNDGTVFSVARTGGATNPALTFGVADSTGATINLSVGTTLGLQIAGANVISFTASAVTIAQPLTLSSALTLSQALTVNAAATINGLATVNGDLVVAPTSGTGSYPATITGIANATVRTLQIQGGPTAGHSYGLFVQAGSNSSDDALYIRGGSGSPNFMQILGDGSGFIGWNGSANVITWNAAGAVTLAAPSSGIPFTVNGNSGGGGFMVGTVTVNAFTTADFKNLSTGTTAASGLRVQNSADSFQFAISSTGYSGSFLPQGPTGEVATLAVGASVPLLLGTANKAWFQITASGALQGYGPTAAAFVDVTPDASTFNGTGTGFTAGPTFACVWARNGNKVTLIFGSGTATSNATTFTMTGLPAAIQPTHTQNCALGFVEDSSVISLSPSAAQVTNSGTVTFLLGGSSSGWTGSGTKGFTANQVISYLLN